jgi:membrane protein implicated in regulation of membrane protease activity
MNPTSAASRWSVVAAFAVVGAATPTGLVWLSGNLGGLVVTLVVGLLVGQPGLAFAAFAVLCLVAVLGVWRLRPHLREPRDDPASFGSASVVDR